MTPESGTVQGAWAGGRRWCPGARGALDFINRLRGLEVLKFSLGRIRSISAIGPLPNLRDLSCDEVHMLEDLGDLQRFPRLRRLQINYLRRLKTLHVGPDNVELEHINVHGIDTIEGFSALPAPILQIACLSYRRRAGWRRAPP